MARLYSLGLRNQAIAQLCAFHPPFSGILSEIAILQQFGATLLGMLIPERKSKVWLATQWGIIVLIAIAMWAFVRLASH